MLLSWYRALKQFNFLCTSSGKGCSDIFFKLLWSLTFELIDFLFLFTLKKWPCLSFVIRVKMLLCKKSNLSLQTDFILKSLLLGRGRTYVDYLSPGHDNDKLMIKIMFIEFINKDKKHKKSTRKSSHFQIVLFFNSKQN